MVDKKVPLIKKNGEMVLALSKTPPSYRKKLITYAPRDLINSICECCQNVLKGNVDMSNDQTTQLKRYSKHIRKLANKKVCIKDKKKLLNQKLGIELLSLLSPIFEPIIKQI